MPIFKLKSIVIRTYFIIDFRNLSNEKNKNFNS